MHQQLWGYEVEEKLYLGVREQKRLNTTDFEDSPVASRATLALSAVYLLLFASLTRTRTRVHTDAAACTVSSIKITTEVGRIKKMQFSIPITEAKWKFGQGEKKPLTFKHMK
jgi:hypothetical protein